MTAPSFIVRPATAADVPGIARVHIDSWRTSYKGVVPDSYLAGLNYADRETSWKRNLAHRYLLVAERQDKVQGFVSGLASREPELGYSAELAAIYLYQDQQGAGMGRVLFNALVQQFKEDGHRRMHLWVLADNLSACGFYQRMGGQKFTEKTIEIGGKQLLEHGYGWPSL